MINSSYSLESESLSDLLEKAKNLLLKKGVATPSQRGLTYSLNNVLLTWSNPQKDKTRYEFWDKKSDTWYQNNFVRKTKANIPEYISGKKRLLIPYRYAQRARYFDQGWGYGLAVVTAAKNLPIKFEKALSSKQNFLVWLIHMSDYVHMQTVLAVLAWWGASAFYWFTNYEKLTTLVTTTRIDCLEKITKEIKTTPNSRRAIMPSFMYTLDYLLDPMMGVPPYQNFQLLPNDKSKPMSSLHFHRSLDASGGAQLDFNHDFDWLSYATKITTRKLGTITILAGNLHLYADNAQAAKRSVNPNTHIKSWLMKVTDGYDSGQGIPSLLITKDNYKTNIDLVFKKLTNNKLTNRKLTKIANK